jgi:hypothetical protein
MTKLTIFQAIDQKLEAQLRLQQYQIGLMEESKTNKKFQDQIKNVVFEVKAKATQLLSKHKSNEAGLVIALFSIDVFDRLPLTAQSFNEISDKEYFQNTLIDLESRTHHALPDHINSIKKAIQLYNQIDLINDMERDYIAHDNGTDEFLKKFFMTVYALFCIVTIIGIPLLYFVKKVGAWGGEGHSYKTFRAIATADLAVVENNPISFVKNFYNQPFTGKYPELKNVKTLPSFKNFCDVAKQNASIELNDLLDNSPELNSIAKEFF